MNEPVAGSSAWQIDPFGHSATQASELSSPIGGFSSLFFGRIDYQDRALRENTSSLEMIWRASPSLGATAQVFTDAMPGYGPPNGQLCWDEVACANNQPIQDDPLLEQYNVDFFVNRKALRACAMDRGGGGLPWESYRHSPSPTKGRCIPQGAYSWR